MPVNVSPQLALAIGLDDRLSFEGFHAGPNAQAVALAQASVSGVGDDVGVYFYGPRGTGKSHLLQAACRAAGERAAVYLPLADALAWRPEVLQGLETMSLVAVDDLQVLAGHADWQEALFHLFNGVRESGGRMLFAATVKPADLGFGLADLVSRLQWGLVLRLQELDDSDKLAALRLRARQRGLDLPLETAQYLLAHCPRDLTYLCSLLDRLDEASLAAQRRLTIPFIREVLAAD